MMTFRDSCGGFMTVTAVSYAFIFAYGEAAPWFFAPLSVLTIVLAIACFEAENRAHSQ